jgi:pyruvate/2-oxoglutarate dehydrogenase complex dihydrolipoamide dehydrogenase (E3) component
LPGLDEVDYLTNETVFALSELPGHLIVIGGGPIGCELSQAFRRLGAQVSLVEMASLLPNDDPELVDVVRTRLRADGVNLYEGALATAVRRNDAGLTLEIERNGARETLSGSTLLVAVGRRPTVEDMDLEAAGIAYDRRGIQVDGRLRTTNPKAYAAGDVAGGYQFTHIAGKADSRAVPWVTYTEPELAHVGMSETAARDRHAQIRVLRWPFAENDRARCEHQDDGFVKVMTTARGRTWSGPMPGNSFNPGCWRCRRASTSGPWHR